MSNQAERTPLRHRLEMVGVNTAGLILRLLPFGLALRLMRGIGLCAGVVFRIRRATVDHNLALAFPQESASARRAIARGAYGHLAEQAGVLLRMAYDDAALDEIVGGVVLADDETPQVVQWLQERHREGQGTLLLMGHFGNWEIAASSVCQIGVPLFAVATTQSNREFDKRLSSMRSRFGLQVIPRNDAKTDVPRALSAGKTVRLVADQFTWDGTPVTFFGEPTLGARGPAVFARRAKVPVVFMSLVAQEKGLAKYMLHLQRMQVSEQLSGRRSTELLTQAYFDQLEVMIRRHPEQYLWHLSLIHISEPTRLQ